MASVTVKVHGVEEVRQALERLEARIRRVGMQEASRRAAETMRDEVASVAPSPRLASSMATELDVSQSGPESVVYRVGTTSRGWHVVFVERGAAPHMITPRRKSVLTDGTEFFGRRVRHPGRRPTPFMRPGFQAGAQDALDTARETLAMFIEATS